MGQKFYELEIWQKGYSLLLKVYDATAEYPIEEKYALTSDTRRSANSVIANIAEAHGRYYFADKVRVLYTSRGEVEETQSHLRVALGRKYISQETLNYFDQEYEGLKMGLNNYLQSIKKQKDDLV